MENFTPPANTKGADIIEQSISLTTAYALISQIALQKLFNSTTNGALTVRASTTYYFDCYFDLSVLSATSGAFGFGFGGTATITSQKWDTIANKSALTTAAAPQTTAGNTTSNVAIAAANVNTVGWARVRGIVRVNAAGTLIPQVSLGVASAAIVGVNSVFRIWQVGSNTQTTTGLWT